MANIPGQRRYGGRGGHQWTNVKTFRRAGGVVGRSPSRIGGFFKKLFGLIVLAGIIYVMYNAYMLFN